MHRKKLLLEGQKLSDAKKALVMVHGRGGTSVDILSLAAHLDVAGYTLIAPQATGNSWYPNSFLASPAMNEPWLSSALDMLNDTVKDIVDNEIGKEDIYFLGFSQGACLSLEFVTRNAGKWGGVVAFSGGLIGDILYPQHYAGNFDGTPVFIASSDPDPHIPVQRVHATTALLNEMGAVVTEKIYPGMGHTITAEEIRLANSIVFNSR